jgi:hypothetical protein
MKTMLERAFELAKGGGATSMDELRRKLVSEGYMQVDRHLDGPSLRKQLNAMMKAGGQS